MLPSPAGAAPTPVPRTAVGYMFGASEYRMVWVEETVAPMAKPQSIATSGAAGDTAMAAVIKVG